MKAHWLMLALLLACTISTQPEDPVWNKQACDHCKMLVSDKRYAASSLDARGQRLFFDDIGCMVAHESDHPPVKAHWVRDEASGSWVEADKAFFRPGASTPMDFGYSGHKATPGISYRELQRALADAEEDRHAERD